MKKYRYFVLAVILIFFGLIFVYIFNKPPWIYAKTVLVRQAGLEPNMPYV